MNRGAYTTIRPERPLPEGMHCPVCGVWQPPEARVMASGGYYRSKCRACTRKHENARMRRRRAEGAQRSSRIDWANPPATIACRSCGAEHPTETYPRVQSEDSPDQSRRRVCKPCRTRGQLESRRRARQARLASAGEGDGTGHDPLWITPTSTTSALAEGNIAADLYAKALRALATSPPVPVWEREEWA